MAAALVASVVLVSTLVGGRWLWQRAFLRLWHWHPFVGLFLAILSFLGVLLSLRERISRREKAGWIVVMLVLVILEFRSMNLYNEDEKDARGKQFGALTALQHENSVLQGALNEVEQFVEHPPPGLTQSQVAKVVRNMIAERAQLPTPAATAAPEATFVPSPPATADLQQLKARGLQEAREIDDWIASVSRDAPGPVQKQQGDIGDVIKARASYVDRLTSEWDARFAPEANSLVDKLGVQGLLLACRPGAFSNDPSYTLELRKLCANRIEQAARSLQ